MSKSFLLSGSLFVISFMVANVINFIFNAFLGRILSFEELGLIAFLNTLFYIGIIFYNGLALTVNHFVASLKTENDKDQSSLFLRFVSKRMLTINFVLAILWALCTAFIATFFHITNYLIIYLFSLVILFYPLVFLNRGYFQGKFIFNVAALLIIAEPIIKFLSALLFVVSGRGQLTYLSLYISSLISVVLSTMLVLLITKKHITGEQKKFHFPGTFYLGSLLTGLSTISFLALDLILVKHFVSPKIAGQYALLSLVGKIIYFLGSLLNVFTVSIVSREERQKKNPLISFYKLFAGSLLLGGIGYICLGIFGTFFAPLLFGKKALVLFPYLRIYSLTILLFTLTNTLVTFHLAKKQFIFPIISFILSLFMIIEISLYHENIQQIVNVIFIASIINTVVLALMHLRQRNVTGKVLLQDVLGMEENI